MRTIILLCLILAGCSSEIIREDIPVAWEVTYTNNVKERVMAHQHSALERGGCFMDRRRAVRCDVRSARRIPLHQVEKDGVMYELE